jgi:hypothetical protein
VLSKLKELREQSLSAGGPSRVSAQHSKVMGGGKDMVDHLEQIDSKTATRLAT